ncbi:hypothetical protein Psi01_79980 [Planobispora siamensis]|uniref:Uncharacterized protein n=1 Tax=Planobispora siamensis TaxID=936338 RepID=A0A8J3WPL6_9ACTN|nr:hypothetical protein Psi01_79980 [Planobispora siamensis]
MLLALTPVWVNPHRGHPASTAGGSPMSVAALADGDDDAVDGCPAGTARSAEPPDEQLARASAIATPPAADTTVRPERRHADPPLPDSI